jgi:hypothetical protein
MLDAVSVEALTRSLVLGTGRHAASVARAFDGLIEPGDQKADLKALALLGQLNRLRRPPPLTSRPSTSSLFADDRLVIPEPARPLLMSLLCGHGAVAIDAVPLAIADAMERRRLKLHPFDLPRLEDFAKKQGEQLGASAVAWSERNAGTTAADAYSFTETVDESNWLQRRPAQKAAFISGLRVADPTRARGLVEGAFAGEPAPVRLALVRAMAERLSVEDEPFLERVAKDRAPSVREAAERLLAMLPGSPWAMKRLQDCLSRIKRKKGGLLRRRTTLELDFPATVKDGQREAWAIATLGTIPLDDFASGLGLSIDELAAAAADDQILMTVLAVQSSRAGRHDLLARVVREGAANAWTAMVQADNLDVPTAGSAATWSMAAIQPDLWPEMPTAALMPLYGRMRGPLPLTTGRSLLGSKAWHDLLSTANEKLPPPVLFSNMAALLPASLRSALRADLATLTPALTARALETMSLLDIIEGA